MLETIKKTTYWLKKFFVNYLWLGIALLLVSITIDLEFLSAQRSHYLTIFIKLLEAIGISVLVASIFSYASSTYDFVEKIRGLLEDIIVKRNFLSNIDPEGKKEALKSLIQPSVSEVNKYPNIGDYYGYFINKILEISRKSVRSNYQINARAYVDKTTNRVVVEGVYSYRLYPCSDGFHDITLGFQKDGDDKSYCEYLSVCTPDGKRTVFDKEKLQLREYSEGGDVSLKTTIPVAELGKGHDRLDVELKVFEYGSDHWILYPFKALQPTDGFRFHIHCEDNLQVKYHAVFLVGANYFLDIDTTETDMTLTCHQWINEGTGISVLVALPHDKITPGVIHS